MKFFKAKNIALPIESQNTVDEDNRFDKGLAVQVEIFGDVIAKKMQENAPANQKHMQDYLSAFFALEISTLVADLI
ncbi:hypothetical protein GCM10020331_003850 [Ectobacillus funiculus]